MDPTKARFLVAADKSGCLVVPICEDYQNTPISITCLPCAQAGQARCSCLKKDNVTIELTIPVYPEGTVLPLPFLKPTVTSKCRRSAMSLSKKEVELAKPLLIEFGEKVWSTERSKQRYRPRSAFFPSSLINFILESFLIIQSVNELEIILRSFPWPETFITSHLFSLYFIIEETQVKIRQSQTRATQKAKQQKKKRERNGKTVKMGKMWLKTKTKMKKW